MADSSQMSCTLSIRKDNLAQSHGATLRVTFTAESPAGPTPASVRVEVGTPRDIDFAELEAMGGLCWLENEGDAGYVEYGVWDGAGYTPFGELLPGEGHPLRLSRRLLTGDSGTADVNVLRIHAFTEDTRVYIGAYDK